MHNLKCTKNSKNAFSMHCYRKKIFSEDLYKQTGFEKRMLRDKDEEDKAAHSCLGYVQWEDP